MTTDQQQRQQRWFRFIVIYCIVLLLVLICFMLWENKLYEHPIVPEDYSELPSASAVYLVNLNFASSEELQELPKIGPVLAGEIIAYRETHGGFSKKEELLQVKGIGKATYETITSLVTV